MAARKAFEPGCQAGLGADPQRDDALSSATQTVTLGRTGTRTGGRKVCSVSYPSGRVGLAGWTILEAAVADKEMTMVGESMMRSRERDPEKRGPEKRGGLLALLRVASVTARTTYRLPYYWSRMRLDQDGQAFHYTCPRRWPGPKGVMSTVRIDVGGPYVPHELTEFDHYLTARWRLYSARRNGLRYALAEHDPWPLRRATLVDVDDELVTATDLPAPQGETVVHWSPGTEARIGFPHRPNAK